MLLPGVTFPRCGDCTDNCSHARRPVLATFNFAYLHQSVLLCRISYCRIAGSPSRVGNQSCLGARRVGYRIAPVAVRSILLAVLRRFGGTYRLCLQRVELRWCILFVRALLSIFSVLKMEPVRSSETSENFYRSTRHHFPEEEV